MHSIPLKFQLLEKFRETIAGKIQISGTVKTKTMNIDGLDYSWKKGSYDSYSMLILNYVQLWPLYVKAEIDFYRSGQIQIP